MQAIRYMFSRWRIVHKSSFEREWDAAAKNVVDNLAGELGMRTFLQRVQPKGYILKRAWYWTNVGRVGPFTLQRADRIL